MDSVQNGMRDGLARHDCQMRVMTGFGPCLFFLTDIQSFESIR